MSPHEGLKVVQTTNKVFSELMEYQYYCLASTSQKHSARASDKLRGFGDKPELKLKKQKYDCSDEVLIFDFLRGLVREADLAAMSAVQMYLNIPVMWKKGA